MLEQRLTLTEDRVSSLLAASRGLTVLSPDSLLADPIQTVKSGAYPILSKILYITMDNESAYLVYGNRNCRKSRYFSRCIN